ncbi:MAG: hypothetical protein WBD47_02785, partial [Phormidesmis sp.]
MLKRFMNWLLHWLQRLFAAVSGRRSKLSKPSQVDFSGVEPSIPPAGDRPTPHPAVETVSERLPAVPSDEPSPPSPQGHREDDLDRPTDSPASGAVTEPDTYRRLNASPATFADAVPSVDPIATITPSEHSEVFALPLEALRAAVRPVGSLEELPDIHDLLPAIEPEDEAEDEPEKEPEDEAEDEPESEPQIEPIEPQIEPESVSEAASAQPVLCSFDITESE